MSYTIFEHTADLGIESRGESLGEALATAAQALSSIVTGNGDLHEISAAGELAFTVEAPDREALVVAFLSEVLWFLESENTLWISGGAVVEETSDGWRATATANAAVYDAARHGQGTEVKAITYHELKVWQDDAWHLRVIIDI